MAALAAGVAGCSSDFSRMTESPWASQAAGSGASRRSNETTGSVRQQAAPTHRVESQALAARLRADLWRRRRHRHLSAARAAPRIHRLGLGPAAARRSAPQQNWSWDGGTAIVVAQGETIDTISRRHGVPAAAIMQANNMTHAAQLQPGQRLVIPRVHHQMGAAPVVSPPTTRVAGPASYAPPAQGNVHVVAPGETIYSLARHYRLTPMAIAKANNVGLDHRVKVGDRVVIPGHASAPRIAAPAQPPPAGAAARCRAAKPEVDAAPRSSRPAEGRAGRAAGERPRRHAGRRSVA